MTHILYALFWTKMHTAISHIPACKNVSISDTCLYETKIFNKQSAILDNNKFSIFMLYKARWPLFYKHITMIIWTWLRKKDRKPKYASHRLLVPFDPSPIPCMYILHGMSHLIAFKMKIEYHSIRIHGHEHGHRHGIYYTYLFWTLLLGFISVSRKQLELIGHSLYSIQHIINNKFGTIRCDIQIQSACSQLYTSESGPEYECHSLLSGQPSISFCRNIEIWCTKEGQKRRYGNNLFEI